MEQADTTAAGVPPAVVPAVAPAAATTTACRCTAAGAAAAQAQRRPTSISQGISFAALMPLLQPHLPAEQSERLSALYQRFKKNETTREDFVRGARVIVGEQVLCRPSGRCTRRSPLPISLRFHDLELKHGVVQQAPAPTAAQQGCSQRAAGQQPTGSQQSGSSSEGTGAQHPGGLSQGLEPLIAHAGMERTPGVASDVSVQAESLHQQQQGPPFVLASEARSPAMDFSTGMAARGSKDASGSASGGGGGQAASGGVKTPVEKGGIGVGQKKRGRPRKGGSQPANKKQKSKGPDAAESIDALNDVTAISGVNLREEEKQLLVGLKVESQTMVAMRKLAQKVGDRLFLEKGPLRTKVQAIAAKCGLSVSDDVERCLSLACEEGLRCMMCKLIAYKQRCDAKKYPQKSVAQHEVDDKVRLKVANAAARAANAAARAANAAARAANAAARAAVGAPDMVLKWQMMAAKGLAKRQGGDTVSESARGGIGHEGAGSREQEGRQENVEAGKAAGPGGLDTEGDGVPGSGVGGRAAEPGPRTGRGSTVRRIGARQGERQPRSMTMKGVIALLGREPMLSKPSFLHRLYERWGVQYK